MIFTEDIFKSLDIPVWIKNKNNKIIFMNEKFRNDFSSKDKETDIFLQKIKSMQCKSTDSINFKNKKYKIFLLSNNESRESIGILVEIPNIIEKSTVPKEKDILKTVIDNIPELIFYKDKDLRYLGVNKECEKFYNNMGVKEIIGKNDLEFPLDRDFVNQCYEHDKIVISSKKPLYIEENTGERFFETIKTPLIDEYNNVKGLVGIVRDISDYKKKENLLIQLSYTDGLTNLYNRMYFDRKIEEIISNKKFPVGLILGDVNGLKIVNDTLGHLEGDKLLKTMSKILTKASMDVGSVFRWGGDEFVILLPGFSEIECASVMKKIDDLCESTVCGNIKLSISQGCAILNEGDSIDKVLVEAEDKVYRKKILSNHSVRTSMLETLKMNLVNKNVETEKHTERVAEFCVDIARELGLDEEMIEKASLIGQLHDIGKIGISEHILLKPGKLTDEEYNIMMTHSEKGYRLASLLPEISSISREILTHHERWDGLGYPLKLREDEIPILSRIVSVVDSFDAMTNDRCYSKGKSIDEGLEELKMCAGTQFDPKIVSIFIDIIEKKRELALV